MALLFDPRRSKRLWAPVLTGAVFAMGLSACSQEISVRGNMPLEEDLARIAPGVHSRNDVARLLGSPSTVSTFEDSKWYYIGQKTTEVAFFAPEILERKVVIVFFDDDGTVAKTQTIGLDESQEIDPVDRITPTEGRKINILQELFGNIGRFGGGSSQ